MNDLDNFPLAPARARWHCTLLPPAGVLCGALAFGGWRLISYNGTGIGAAAISACLIGLLPALWNAAAHQRAMYHWRESPPSSRWPQLPYTQPGSQAAALSHHGGALLALVFAVLRTRNGVLLLASLAGVALALGLGNTGFVMAIALFIGAQFVIAFNVATSRAFSTRLLHALWLVLLPMAQGSSRALTANSLVLVFGIACAGVVAVLQIVRIRSWPLLLLMAYLLFIAAT